MLMISVDNLQMPMNANNTNRIKICLIGASFETWNMGVSALAEAAVQCIIQQWPDAEILVLGGKPLKAKRSVKLNHKEVEVSNIPIRFSKNIFHRNHFLRIMFYIILLRIFPFKRLKDKLINLNPCLKLILQTELFADITGGDSFSDIYGTRRFLYGFLPKLLPTVANKELILLPQTYGPFKSRFTRAISRYILRRSKIIYSRDAASAEYVKEILGNNSVQGRVQVVPDVAFALDSREPASLDVGKLQEIRTDKNIVVGLNISGLLYNGGYTGDNMFGLREDYKQVVGQIAEFFLKKENVLLLLIPHVYPPCGTVNAGLSENDFAACRYVYDKLAGKYSGRVFTVQGDYDQSQIKYIIGFCDFFLGSRMHSCIAALSLEIPAIGLAYSQKFAGVFDTVGVADLTVDLRTETQKEIEELTDKAFEQRQRYREILAGTIPTAKQKVLNVFNSVV